MKKVTKAMNKSLKKKIINIKYKQVKLVYKIKIIYNK